LISRFLVFSFSVAGVTGVRGVTQGVDPKRRRRSWVADPAREELYSWLQVMTAHLHSFATTTQLLQLNSFATFSQLQLFSNSLQLANLFMTAQRFRIKNTVEIR
jgi:hypothetical protein